MQKILVGNDKYNGRYVAIKDFNDYTVVGDGLEPQNALKKAAENGYPDPVILYVPEKDLIHIY